MVWLVLEPALESWRSESGQLDPLLLARRGDWVHLAAVAYFHPKAIQSSRSSYSQHTVLHMAALHGEEQCVDIAIKAGATVNEPNGQDKTALHVALGTGHHDRYIRVARRLIEAGAIADCWELRWVCPQMLTSGS